MGLGCGNYKGNRAGYEILNSYVTTQIPKAGRNDSIARIAVSGLPCKRIHHRQTTLVSRVCISFLSPIALITSFHFYTTDF